MNTRFASRLFSFLLVPLLLVVGVLTLAQPAATQSELFPDPPSLYPSPRGYVSMAYDSQSDLFVLVGGQLGNILKDPTAVSGATWVYNLSLNEWIQKEPADFGRRAAYGLTYDAESDRVILFGGGNEEVWALNDTWAYDTDTDVWVEMAEGPLYHLGPRLAYDAESDKVILFGGLDLQNGSFFNDTWAYDYNTDTWTEMEPVDSPPGRNFHAMAYDYDSDLVIIWGGVDMNNVLLNEVWAYDYNTDTWTEMPLAEMRPGTLDFTTMAYDATSDRMVVFGGVTYDKGKKDLKLREQTWAYDYNANEWTLLASEEEMNPGQLSRHALAYSEAANEVVLFGGQIRDHNFKYSDETWGFDCFSNTWKNLTVKK